LGPDDAGEWGVQVTEILAACFVFFGALLISHSKALKIDKRRFKSA
jgi:hypothetical protein